MIGEGWKLPHWCWNPILTRRIIRRCTNLIKRGSPTLKREAVTRCAIPYKRCDRRALLWVKVKRIALSCERDKVSVRTPLGILV